MTTEKGGRPKGVKMPATMLAESRSLTGDAALVIDAADPLDVMEQVMLYFYRRGVAGAKNKEPDEKVERHFKAALQAAIAASPFRHPRLSAIKHIDTGGVQTMDGIRSDAPLEELRAEITKRVAILRDKGLVDLDALEPPKHTNGHDSGNGATHYQDQAPAQEGGEAEGDEET